MSSAAYQFQLDLIFTSPLGSPSVTSASHHLPVTHDFLLFYIQIFFFYPGFLVVFFFVIFSLLCLFLQQAFPHVHPCAVYKWEPSTLMLGRSLVVKPEGKPMDRFHNPQPASALPRSSLLRKNAHPLHRICRYYCGLSCHHFRKYPRSLLKTDFSEINVFGHIYVTLSLNLRF